MICNTTEFEKNHCNIDKGKNTSFFVRKKVFKKVVNPFSQTNGDKKTLQAESFDGKFVTTFGTEAAKKKLWLSLDVRS